MFSIRRSAMRKIHILSALLLCSVAASAAEISFLPEPKIPRKITVGSAPRLEMVKAGKVNFELVVPADASTPAKFAGNEAAEQLSAAFGQKIDVLSAPSGKVPAIVIGDVKLAKKNGIDIDKLDRDGFVIRTVGNQVLIVGRDTQDDPRQVIIRFGDKGQVATLFGVYDFLERFAGIRYYYPGKLGTIIPRRTDWSLPEIDIYDRPDFTQRRFVDEQKVFPNYYQADQKKWRSYWRPVNMLRHRMETIVIPNCHGLNMLGFKKRFAKTHPEYFALNATGARITGTPQLQLCYSSKVRDEIIADAKAFLSGRPASERGVLQLNGKVGWQFHIFPKSLPCFNIMPDDSMYWCTCPQCAKLKTAEERNEFMWSLFAEAANTMKKEKIPGYLTTMAYGQYRSVPKTEIPDNLLVMLATRGAWNENNIPVRDAEMALLRDWTKKLGGKTWLWTYPGKYHGRCLDIPHTTPRAAASFVKRAKPYIFGIFFESASERAIYNYLFHYVFGKILWDPDTDIDALLAEHARLMYGPAAKPMQEFFESVERNWMKIASDCQMGASGPAILWPSDLDIWNKIYSEKEIARINGLFREAKKLCAKDPDALARVNLLEQEMWLPTCKAAAEFRVTQQTAANWKAFMPAADGKPVIDGKLDDPAWKKAGILTLSPLKDNAPAEVKTVIRLLHDDDNYYIGVECEEPGTAVTFDRPRDGRDLYKDSTIEIFLSPDRHPQRYFQWMINPSASFCDLCRPNGTRGTPGNSDGKWQSNAEIKTAVEPGKCWTAEIRIPKSDMPAPSPEGILADFGRHRNASGVKVGTDLYNWSPAAHSFGDIDRFGTLVLGADTRKNLLADGDFDAPAGKNPIFCGKWRVSAPHKTFPLDRQFFVSGGASARLEDAKSVNVSQNIKLKPDTEYVLSFYCRMRDVRSGGPGSRFIVYVNEGSGKHIVLPRKSSLRGSCPWSRVECRFRTSAEAGKKSGQTVSFQFIKMNGTVWIDHVELYELDKNEK